MGTNFKASTGILLVTLFISATFGKNNCIFSVFYCKEIWHFWTDLMY